MPLSYDFIIHFVSVLAQLTIFGILIEEQISTFPLVPYV
jgi:hypothetical protein